MNIYVKLTYAFNRDGLRAVLAGGQAVALHRLAVMSKDGDWILREDEGTMLQVLSVLSEYGAHYRFGAPLDIRWLSGGWSAHFEFQHCGIRVRADFMTRPPRMTGAALETMWREQAGKLLPFAGARDLADMKKTSREKDYAVIGELARTMTDPDVQMLYSRSARDLMRMASDAPARMKTLAEQRPALTEDVWRSSSRLEAALDAERRQFMHANEAMLARYSDAAEPWAAGWPGVARAMDGLSMAGAHDVMKERALNLLPFNIPGGSA